MARKVLVIAESVTLAHIARALTLGQALHAQGVEVHFAFDRYFDLNFQTALSGISRHSVRSISPAAFSSRIKVGQFPYTVADLQSYVEEDLRLLKEVRPDVVVGDFRLSLLVSARTAGIPYWNVTNAHWSPGLAMSYPFLGSLLARYVPELLLHQIAKVVFGKLSANFDELLKSHGMAPLGDLRKVYTAGDLTLFADPPGWVPLRPESIAGSHRFVGPIPYEPDLPMPSWWEEASASDRLALVNLGSSGATALAHRTAQELIKMGFTVIVSGIKDLPASSPKDRLFCAPFLPTWKVLKKAKLFVCNGGAPNAYAALKEGCAVVGVISNYDQALVMSVLERHQAGKYFWDSKFSAAALRKAVQQVVGPDGPNSGVKKAKEQFEKSDFRSSLPALLSETGIPVEVQGQANQAWRSL